MKVYELESCLKGFAWTSAHALVGRADVFGPAGGQNG